MGAFFISRLTFQAPIIILPAITAGAETAIITL